MYTNAIRQCKKVLFFDHKNALALNALGSAYKSQQDLDNAVYTFLSAINIDASNRVAQFRVAMIFALENKYNQAIPHFEKVRSFGPEPPELIAYDGFSCYRASMEMLSLCYEKTSRLKRQQGVLEELARSYPDYAKTSRQVKSLNQIP
jgi:tetratricopeptide (TPR) repeat protein